MTSTIFKAPPIDSFLDLCASRAKNLAKKEKRGHFYMSPDFLQGQINLNNQLEEINANSQRKDYFKRIINSPHADKNHKENLRALAEALAGIKSYVSKKIGNSDYISSYIEAEELQSIRSEVKGRFNSINGNAKSLQGDIWQLLHRSENLALRLAA